jgi:hypothetical protein
VVWSHFGPFLESAQSFSAGQVWFRPTLFGPFFILYVFYIIIIFIIIYFYISVYLERDVDWWSVIIPWICTTEPHPLRIENYDNVQSLFARCMCRLKAGVTPSGQRIKTWVSCPLLISETPWRILRHIVTNVNHIETICRTFLWVTADYIFIYILKSVVIFLIPPKMKILVFANGNCKWGTVIYRWRSVWKWCFTNGVIIQTSTLQMVSCKIGTKKQK